MLRQKGQKVLELAPVYEVQLENFTLDKLDQRFRDVLARAGEREVGLAAGPGGVDADGVASAKMLAKIKAELLKFDFSDESVQMERAMRDVKDMKSFQSFLRTNGLARTATYVDALQGGNSPSRRQPATSAGRTERGSMVDDDKEEWKENERPKSLAERVQRISWEIVQYIYYGNSINHTYFNTRVPW